MRTQFIGSSESARIRRFARSRSAPALLGPILGPGWEADAGWLSARFAVLLRSSVLAVVALLMALGPIATARAIPLPELVPTGSVAGSGLVWSDFEINVSADLVASSHSYELDFGTAGLTVTGPFARADGESGGMVIGWTATSRDPAYLFTATSLFPQGVSSWTAGDEILRDLPNLGVVPGGNLSVFDTGAVDVISWNFLEYSCALLVLRVEDYVRLKDVLEPGDYDLNARVPVPDRRLSPVPDPATSLLTGQGLLVLALLGPRRLRSRRAP